MNDSSPLNAGSSADGPWPGLAPFTEAQSGQFFGRDAEIKTLARRTQGDSLTVLFGQSGLGKSSLLQAGVLPRLRSADFCPIYIRLDHGPESALPVEQVKDTVRVETARVGKWTRPELEKPGESLWEFFHHRDNRLISPGGIALSPVLVFDQFEELFTLGGGARSTSSGSGSGTERERAVAFITALAELVENRPPAVVEARLEESSEEMDAFDFSAADYRVIITLREDYLPHLETLKTIMPTLMDNRMRLSRMNGVQALEAVIKPGAGLVDETVARAIVEFVAGARGGSAERLAELDVEPPLLSVICRELNERRRALGQAQITADLVSGNRREILTDFYERSVADLPEAMRRFVEEKLLTKSGFRDNLALETALEEPGVTRELIDTLVARRLLRIEDRIGVQRVELAHDVLAEVIRAARDARQQRRALEAAAARAQQARADTARRTRRLRITIGGLVAAVVALCVGAVFGLRAQRRAERLAREKAAESSRTDFVFGSRLLEDNKTPQGLAYLVRAARSDPSNHLVGPRLISALAYRSFAEPVGIPLRLPKKIGYAQYVGEGRAITWETIPSRARTAELGDVNLWDIEQARVIQTISVAGGIARVSDDGRLLALGGLDGAVKVWETESARVLFTVQHEQRIVYLVFSPDGRWLVVASADRRLKIWDARTGEVKGTLSERADFDRFVISPDSTRLVTTIGHFRIWRLPGGEPMTPVIAAPPGMSNASWVRFSSDGKLFGAAHGPNIQIYESTSGARVGPTLTHGGEAVLPAISHDNTRVATNSSDGSIRFWAFPSGKLLHSLQFGGDINGGPMEFTPDDRHYLAHSGDGMVHIIDVETGKPALEPIKAGHVLAAKMRTDGGELMTIGRDGVVRRWRFTPGAIRPVEIATSSTTRLVQRAADESTAWAIGKDRIQPMDLLTGRPNGPARMFPVPISNGIISPNGQYLSVQIEDGQRELWTFGADAVTRRVLPPTVGPGANATRFSPNSAYLACKNRNDLQVIDTRSGEVIIGPLPNLTFFAGRNPHPFSPSSKYLVAYSDSAASISLIDLHSRSVGKPMPHSATFTLVQFSADERFLSTSPIWGSIGVHDLIADRPVGELMDTGAIAKGGVFSHDGKRMLTWTRLDMKLWDIATGRQLTDSMSGGVDYDPALFSPDDTQVATVATTSGEVRIFDAASGLLISEPIPGAGRTNLDTGTFTAAGRFIITTRRGSGLLVAPVPPHSIGRVPEWLLQLGTGMAGGELDSGGKLQPRALDAKDLAAVRAELASLPANAPYAEWGRWLLSDRATRPIGPGFKITTAEWEKHRDEAAKVAATTPAVR